MGVIGVGNMGSHHIQYIDEIEGARLTAIADVDPEKLDAARNSLGDKADDVEFFGPGMDLIEKGPVDAVLIATPHYDHPPLTIAAFKKGIHVLCEKPVAVTAKAAAEVEAAWKRKKNKPVWGAMFQQRTQARWKKVKQLIADGQIGQIQRVNWIITSWFRSQAYYDSGGWRATWEGEGGAVLINQCPHNLDLITWFCGVPERVTALVGLGKHHKIEAEDDVTAMLEYPNGATGVFVTTTGDCPGTNRLEITGDAGRIIVGERFELLKTHQPVKEYSFTTDQAFGSVAYDVMDVTVGGKDHGHRQVTEQFIAAVLADDDSLLVAHASDGIKGLELGNAMLMSGLTGEPVKIPTPRDKYEKLLKDLASKSTFKKPKPTKKAKVDLGASYT